MSMVEKPLVLLVDDNEATCTLITAILQREFMTEVARDGGQAVEKLKTKQYAATLLDIRMPHTDGYAVLDHLKTNRPEALRSVLIVTAALGHRDLGRVKEYDVFGVLEKPFDVEELLALVKRCAAGSSDGPSLSGRFFNGTMMFLLADLIHRVR